MSVSDNRPSAPDESQEHDDSAARALAKGREFNALSPKTDEYTDDRTLWDWESKWPTDAKRAIRYEAWYLLFLYFTFIPISGVCLALAGNVINIPIYSDHYSVTTSTGGQTVNNTVSQLTIDFRVLVTFFVGCVGATTFSLKWLIHAAAKGKWHLDRRYWRVLTPLMGGVYACVVLTLFDAGLFTLFAGQAVDPTRPVAITAALAFVVGYFADGVSGLLSNIAKAAFGTLEHK